jgi:hypothetical protein
MIHREMGWAFRPRVFSAHQCAAIADRLSARLPSRKADQFNPVEVAEDDDLHGLLSQLSEHPALLDFAEFIIGPDIGLYNQRFVVKDQHSRAAVPLHQDTPYHKGFPEKWSFFVALAEMTPYNGLLVVYQGSHQLGHLGDAGEIRADLAAGFRAVRFPMMPGDVLAMHSSCWHESLAHTSGPDRLLADIILQPASDPSTVAVLRGHRRTPLYMPTAPFVSCRVSRLRDLQSQVSMMRSHGPGSSATPDRSEGTDRDGRGGSGQGGGLVPAVAEADRAGADAHRVGASDGLPEKARP